MVYVINIKNTNLYKIGIAVNVENRYNELYRIIPYDLILVNTYKVNHDKTVEFSLHKHFEDKRVRGEWFVLDDKDIVELDKCVPLYDVRKYDRVKVTPKRNPKFNNVTELMGNIYRLEKKYKGMKGIGDSRVVIGNELGISDGMITKLKRIHKVNPSLLDDIDNGLISVSSAYVNLK
jgi:hypothetical protein